MGFTRWGGYRVMTHKLDKAALEDARNAVQKAQGCTHEDCPSCWAAARGAITAYFIHLEADGLLEKAFDHYRAGIPAVLIIRERAKP
jgi:hypothetical protein